MSWVIRLNGTDEWNRKVGTVLISKTFTSFPVAQSVLLEHHLGESSLALSANTELTLGWLTPEIQTSALSEASRGHWHLLRTKVKLRLLYTLDSKELNGEIWLSGPVSSHLEKFEMVC